MLLVAVSCSQDLSDVNGRLEDLEGRVARLEKLCEEMNKNISSLQGIVTATETGDVITSVTPIVEGGKTVGYTLTFAKGDPITIYHGQDGADGKDGKDGKDGTNGKDGKDGADGHTPVIGVKQDTDGIWYWTIDGEWLLDTNGQKVKAVGTDGAEGKDGITPQLKIEDGYWYVSTDNGATWTQLGKATGEDGKDGKDGTDGKDGDSMFQSVTVTDTEVTFVTADGQTFVVKRAAALAITFDTEDVVAMGFNATQDINYTITAASDDVTIEALSSSDIKVKVVPADAKTGVLNIKTGSKIDEYSKVVVLVSCGTQTITRTLRIELETKAYAAPNLGDADVQANYDWYGQLTTKQKAFMLPHIQTSFINAQWYAWDNLIYVISGEISDAEDCENIGMAEDGSSHLHADGGYTHYRSIAPWATIKSSGGGWDYFEAYLLSHPNNIYCVSVADEWIIGDSVEQLAENPYYDILKRILENDNVIICCASSNKSNWNNNKKTKTLNEDCPKEDEGVYRTNSVNSFLNNKICVTGYNPDTNNFFGWSGDSDSCRPIGFGKEKHNIVMPMFNLNYDTASSFSTAMFSGTLGNYLSIIMRTHPGVTLEGANTILQENYLREETFKYVDDSDSSIKDGGQWYFFNTDKFFAYEVLQKEAVDAAVEKIAGQADGAVVALPGGYGICYTGPGVQFEVAGERFDMTEDNRAAFEAAWTADPSAIKWYFSSLQALIYGASGTSELTVGVLDTSARLIPDVSRAVTVSLP